MAQEKVNKNIKIKRKIDRQTSRQINEKNYKTRILL